jgi:hypothetical protein
MALLGHARGASRRCIGFENLTSPSSVAAPRRRGIGASGGSASLYSGTGAQGGDSWAQALVSETGLSVSVGAKRHTTAGGGTLFTRRFAFSAHRNRCAKYMTCGPGPPCHRLDRWLRRSRGSVLPRGGSMLLCGGSPS